MASSPADARPPVVVSPSPGSVQRLGSCCSPQPSSHELGEERLMVADNHEHRDRVDEREVRQLFARVVGVTVDGTFGLTLEAVGIDDDVGRFRVWQYAAEEFAERSVAEPDVMELLSARTTDELI